MQATITGKLWDHLEERFPLAWHQTFRQATNDKGISQSYAMAIARQESAFTGERRRPDTIDAKHRAAYGADV